MMDRSTYLSAQEAVAEGFVDKVMEFDSGQEEVLAVADDGSGMIPEPVMAKIRALIEDKMKDPETPDPRAAAQARLDLLKLRTV